MQAFDTQARERIAANIFPAAHKAVDPWEEFPWHRDRTGAFTAHVPWSSQALAIDVFGTIAGMASKDRIVQSWLSDLGIATRGAWQVCLEEQIPRALLGEPRSTQVDAVAYGEDTLVLFECKFTESAGGSCSQPHPLRSGRNRGVRQCNGSYAPQVNPVNGMTNHCALTGKQIRYWDWIPEVVGYDASTTYEPCPFAGSHFQWMRNVVAAAALGASRDRTPVFVLVHAGRPGHPEFPVAAEVRSDEWRSFAKRVSSGPVELRTASYSDLLRLALRTADDADAATLEELQSWVAAKEAAGADHLQGQ